VRVRRRATSRGGCGAHGGQRAVLWRVGVRLPPRPPNASPSTTPPPVDVSEAPPGGSGRDNIWSKRSSSAFFFFMSQESERDMVDQELFSCREPAAKKQILTLGSIR